MPGLVTAAGSERSRLWAQAAVSVGQVVSRTSRRLGLGAGSTIGGRAILALDPEALRRLSVGRRVALVSGTNGKTTTTRLLAAALATDGPVVSNDAGANLPPGLVAALAAAPPGGRGALEVDEAWLGQVAEAVRPRAMALLNLSRDQLDRVSEVRSLGARWRAAVAAVPGAHVVANADDPIVAWAASEARRVTWVAAGQSWRLDAAGCPACGGHISFDAERWACPRCGLARPAPRVWLEGDDLVVADGRRLPFALALPGHFNRANAAMAGVVAEELGVPLDRGLAAMAGLVDVAGRYQVVPIGPTRDGTASGAGPGEPGRSVSARLLLAKNPAGWAELLDLLDAPPAPVVLAINARVADGRDPSWLWDVPFERLAGRQAVVTGDRRRDLAVRLAYAEVDHLVVADPLAAVSTAAELPGANAVLDVVANYTAFQDLRGALGREGRR
ncbi:MAG TPA: MurT ligase domain-containing protein [Acidimicrobiales bacterium]|nr:MurT ligase domain-containing protein [Acidimicrobiales bacterium]